MHLVNYLKEGKSYCVYWRDFNLKSLFLFSVDSLDTDLRGKFNMELDIRSRRDFYDIEGNIIIDTEGTIKVYWDLMQDSASYTIWEISEVELLLAADSLNG